MSKKVHEFVFPNLLVYGRDSFGIIYGTIWRKFGDKTLLIWMAIFATSWFYHAAHAGTKHA